MNQKTILLITLGLIAFLVLDFGLGFVLGKSVGLGKLEKVKNQLFSEIDQKFAEKVNDNSLFLPGLGPEIEREIEIERKSLSGEIVSLDYEKGILKVKVKNRYEGESITEFLAEPSFYIKEVLKKEDTKIIKRERLTPELIEQGIFEPKETEISLKDLTERQSIYVETETEFKLEENQEIKAKIIRIQ